MSFDSAAFSTDAFSTDAFDLDAGTVEGAGDAHQAGKLASLIMGGF